MNECDWRIYTTKSRDISCHRDISWPHLSGTKKLLSKYNALYLFFLGSFIEIG